MRAWTLPPLVLRLMTCPRLATPTQFPSTRSVISPLPMSVVLPTVAVAGTPTRTRRSLGSAPMPTVVPV